MFAEGKIQVDEQKTGKLERKKGLQHVPKKSDTVFVNTNTWARLTPGSSGIVSAKKVKGGK